MRITDLLGPQSPARKRKSSGTLPEVFIIESLELADEAKERREGAVLAAVLKMCGKSPLYYYIRTKAELEYMAKEFSRSSYRYLHISCHGGDLSLDTTLDPVPYRELAKIFAGRLNERRLFVSACSAGTELFAETMRGTNKELISVAAPTRDIRFDHAVAFWSAFYVKTFSLNAQSMKSDRIIGVLKPLCTLFGEPVHFSKSGKDGKWVHEIIGGDSDKKSKSAA
jgi:hypothetical protein